MNLTSILLVDDEVLVLSSLTRALQTEGVEITAVKTAEEALSLVVDRFYGLCFLDVCLPGMDGVAAVRQIKMKSLETKIAIMTTHDLDGGSRASIVRSADDFISKPFDIKERRATVDEAISS